MILICSLIKRLFNRRPNILVQEELVRTWIVLGLGLIFFVVAMLAIIRERINVGGRHFRTPVTGVAALLIAIPQALAGGGMLIISGSVLLGAALLEPYVITSLVVGVAVYIITNGLGLIYSLAKRD